MRWTSFCLRFNPNPRLVVAGLNPHAGEQGQLGTEELDWLMPLLERWRLAHPNVTLLGPVPPDTCWLSAAQAWNQLLHPTARMDCWRCTTTRD